MRVLAAILFGTLAGGAEAQQVVDNSPISSEQKDRLIRAILSEVSDPYGAQLAQISFPQEGMMCGLINNRNTYGGFVGFTRFVFEMREGRVYFPVLAEDRSRESVERTARMAIGLDRLLPLCG